MNVESFAPIVDKNCIAIILGTMPGIESLRQQNYYSHKQNLFWKLVFSVFNKPVAETFQEKAIFLLQNKIALWDVLRACYREGSLDANITNEIPNNFETFFSEYQNIRFIFFNGNKARKLYEKFIGFSPCFQYNTLPSSSPANASKNFEQKLLEWKKIAVC